MVTIKNVMNKIKYFFSKEYCYDNLDKNFIRQDGSCKGEVGGDWTTEYLSECCIGCKYFSWKGDK